MAAITRDDVLHDRLRQRLRDEAAQGLPDHLLSEKIFQRTLNEIIDQLRPIDDVWIFAYGSLIWSPTFLYVEEAVADLPGYARQFCMWAETGRGTPEQPGLWLALDEAAADDHCTGVAFRLDNREREHELLMLWRREMVTGSYVPAIRAARIGGTMRPCLCLLANKAHDRYAGHLPLAAQVESIARAEGRLGTCREYLFRLIERLESLNVTDAALLALADAVREYRAEHNLGA